MATAVDNIWAWLKAASPFKGIATTSSYALLGSNAEISGLGLVEARGAVQSVDALFTQTTGNGIYTGSVDIPAGATIHDIIVSAVALWDGTSADMDIGDATDPDGYFTAIDLKATDLLAGENLSFALAGGKAGAYIAASQANERYNASARVISGIITQVGTGTLGITRMTVIYSLPVDVVVAGKV